MCDAGNHSSTNTNAPTTFRICDPEPEPTADHFFPINPSLENLAALRLATTLCQNECSDLDKSSLYANDSFLDNIKKHIKNLNLPTHLEEKILILSKQANIEMREFIFWLYKKKRYGFLWPPQHYRTNKFISCIVWTSLGTVNYAESAKAILEADFLTDFDAYALACSYCIVDRIYRLAPKVVHTAYLDNIDPYHQRLIHFWTYCVSNDIQKLNRLPYVMNYLMSTPNFMLDHLRILHTPPDWCLSVQFEQNPDTGLWEFVNKGNELDFRNMVRYMLSIYDVVNNEAACMYFWNLLPQSDHADLLPGMLQRYTIRHTRQLLARLSKEQQRHFVNQNGHFLLCDYLHTPLEGDYIHRLGLRVRDHITGSQLARVLMHWIVKTHEFQYTPAKPYYLVILKNLWRCVPEPVRRAFFERHSNEVSISIDGLDINTHVYIIRLALEDSDDVESAMRVLNSQYGRHICLELVKQHKFETVEELMPNGMEWFNIRFTREQRYDFSYKLLQKAQANLLRLECRQLNCTHHGGVHHTPAIPVSHDLPIEVLFPPFKLVVPKRFRSNGVDRSKLNEEQQFFDDISILESIINTLKKEPNEEIQNFVITQFFKDNWPILKSIILSV